MHIFYISDKAKALGLKPLAHISGYGLGGVNLAIRVMSPMLAKQNELSTISLFIDKNEGTIALYHVVSASRTQMLASLLHALNSKKPNATWQPIYQRQAEKIASIAKQIFKK